MLFFEDEVQVEGRTGRNLFTNGKKSVAAQFFFYFV